MTERALSTYDPAELQRILPVRLPERPIVRATPSDKDGRRCASWHAHHYELQAYYTTSDLARLDGLEAAMAALPEVYRTTRKAAGDGLVDDTWPTRRRDVRSLRPQVLALMLCGRDVG